MIVRQRRELAAGILWILAPVVFLGLQHVVALQWAGPMPYSWSANNVSDLGNVQCAEFGDIPRFVCSPAHGVMNAAFVLNSVLLIGGLLLAGPIWRGTVPRVAWLLLICGSGGYAVAGSFPADVDLAAHLVGAALIMLAGALGTMLSGSAWRRAGHTPVAWAAPVFAIVGIAAAILFLTGHDLRLGPGGMERVAGYASQAWLLTAGLSLVRAHLSTGRRGDRQEVESPK